MIGEVGQPDHQGERRITEDNPTGSIFHTGGGGIPDYGGDQESKKACKNCEHIRTKTHSGRSTPRTYECNHMACFELGAFNPYEGKSRRNRIKDYLELNRKGDCDHFAMEIIR